MRPRTALKGEAALFASATLFALVSLFVKFASSRYAGSFVSSSRFVIGAALCLMALRGRRPSLDGLGLRLLLLRGLVGSASMVSTYIAISLTGPGRATLLSNTYPIFVAIFGALLFKEAFEKRILLSLALCTAGAVLVVRDGSGASIQGDILALIGSVLAGLAVNFVRRASSRGIDPFLLYLSPCLFGLPLLFWAPFPEGSGGAAGIILLLAVGAGAFLAQALMARGYGTVSAGRGSVVFYWETALTVILGMLFAGESATPRFFVGLSLIAAGLLARSGEKPAGGVESGRQGAIVE